MIHQKSFVKISNNTYTLAERVTDDGWEVAHNTTELIVTQYDEEYRITAHGTVEGDGQYRTPLENIVEMEKQ